MLAFYVECPSIHTFRVVYLTLVLLKTLHFLQSHVIPVFVRSIDTPPYHNFSSEGHTQKGQCCFGAVSQRDGAANQPYPKPLPSPSCIPSILAAMLANFGPLVQNMG